MAICSVARGAGGSKLVWHARDLPRKRLVERWCGGRAHRIIAVSHAVKDLLLTSGSDEEKVDVVYNGVDPPAEPMPVAGSNDCFTFANVGQLVEWKNQEDFLAAAELVHARLPRTRFLLVGSNVFDRNGRYESKLKARIKTRQMSYVQPMGWKTDMKPVWEQTDCLVHTALREPFGRVLIEAMAHGRPVVAFASGGPAEVVADGRTGLLAPFGDVRTLSEAMLRVAQEPGLAAAMGRAARRRADEHFSARCTADAVMSVYNKVLNGC